MNDKKGMKGFVNPYHFIHFPKAKAKAYTDEDRHTGVIHYMITTKTPLFIPNSSSETAFTESKIPEHKSYDFFSYTELDAAKKYEKEYHEPVIPGSEMRGVVRNVYETLTDSCMGVLNADTYPVKRSAERFASALLHRNALGKLELLEADSIPIGIGADAHWVTLKNGKKVMRATKPPEGFENCHNGAVVYYKNGKSGYKQLEETSRQPEKDPNYGYLLKWGMGVGKLHYHALVPKNKKPVSGIRISRDIVERKMFPMLDSYLDQPALSADNKNAYEEYAKDLKNFLSEKKEAYFPVTYSKLDHGVFYLAPATFSKEVSDHNIGNLAGVFKPCETEYCPACALFGYIGKNNENAKGSKIRFSDLYTTDGAQKREPEQIRKYYLEENDGKVTLQTLGGPKLGNVDFYLKKPDEQANFWTYDYYIKNGRTHLYDEAENKNGIIGQLRGRKYYWHHRSVNTTQEIEVTKLNKTIRPVRPEVSFKGELYFEGISEKQLNQLIWILNSSKQEKERELGLKLGGAKPLGYGSVVCEVSSVEERKLDMTDNRINYRMVPYETDQISYENAGFSAEVKDEFYVMADLHAVPENVEITYPKTEDQKGKPLTEGFQWFGKNHGTISGKGMPKNRADVVIKNVLPDIMEEDFSLPYYKNYSKKNNGKNSFQSNGKGGNHYGQKKFSHNGSGNGQRRNNDGRNNNQYRGKGNS